ncbi:MAG TPA: biotin/lipoyl-binding protein, partial [Gemmatimonadaceae bacterium]|nr:biotin/lipoyl-binding protein [Gemmatimonadaceae bacterium]
MNRRQITLTIAGIVALLLLAWGVRAWTFARSHESTDNAQVDGRIVPILAKVGGYVQRVNVGENDRVAPGQPLVQIDEAEYRQRLAQAEADLQGALAASGADGSPGQAEAQVMTASGQQSSLEAQIVAARSTAQRAAADLARAEDLVKQQIISRAQLDGARTAAEASQANVTALEQQAAAAGASVAGARGGVRLAAARAQAARASRDLAALQLQYAKVTAPEAGIVSRKQVEIGQLVQA